MDSIDSLDNQPSISCGFVENMQLYVGHGRYGRSYGITYTEEVAGSSPVPPTLLGAVPKGQPPRCNLKALGFPRFALDPPPLCSGDFGIQAPLPEKEAPTGALSSLNVSFQGV